VQRGFVATVLEMDVVLPVVVDDTEDTDVEDFAEVDEVVVRVVDVVLLDLEDDVEEPVVELVNLTVDATPEELEVELPVGLREVVENPTEALEESEK
jgi:hypothetical protein